jgi:ABC-type Fe3+ transport system, permease component
MMPNKKNDIWTYLPIAIILMYFVTMVFPLFTLLKEGLTDSDGAFSLHYIARFFSENYYRGALLNSIKVTVSVTILAILIATPLAYLMTTIKIKGATFIQVLILISSMSPPFIGSYSWILLLGRSGIVTKFFASIGIRTPSIYGFIGILVVLTLQLIPLIFMYLMGALKNIDNSIIEAAESMGCTGVKKIIKVIYPLILPTLLAGALLVFMRAFADFGTPMLIGEGYQTVPVLIFNEFMSEMGGDTAFASGISIIVVIFAITVFILQKFIATRQAFSMSALHPIEAKKEKGLKNILAHTFIYAYLFAAIAPQLYVVYTAFMNTSGKIFVAGYSLDSFSAAISKSKDALSNTFIIAVISILIVIALAVVIAYVTVRRKNVITNTLDIFTMLPYIVPGSIIGIALLLTFNKRPILISGTFIIMILAFVIRRLPYTIRSSAAIVHQISPSVEEAAQSLGASNFATFFKIVLPMMLPGIISGAILSWISIITELSTSIILYTSRTRTMTIAIYTEVIRGNYGTAAALSTILTVIVVISLLTFFKVSGKKEVAL